MEKQPTIKENKGMKKLALLSVSLLVVSGGAIAGNIPEIKTAYPEIPLLFVELLTTIPSLSVLLTVLLSSKIAQTIGYKTAVLLGLWLILISGTAPLFVESFWLIFLSRIGFGIGVGLFNPLLFQFASSFYQEKELSAVIGLQSAFEGIGGMLITFSVGRLLLWDWKLSFLVYGIVLPIIFLFQWFVPDINKSVKQVKQNSTETTKEYPESVKAVPIVTYVFLLVALVTIYMSITVKITGFIQEGGYGDATAGSNLLALVGLGAMLAGFLFGRIYQLMNRYILPFALFGFACALLLLSFSSTIRQTSVAVTLGGFSFRMIVPYLFNEVNQDCSGNAARNNSLLLVGFNLGAAFATVGVTVIESFSFVSGTDGIFFSEAIVLLLLMVISLIVLLKQRQQKRVEQNTEKV